MKILFDNARLKFVKDMVTKIGMTKLVLCLVRQRIFRFKSRNYARNLSKRNNLIFFPAVKRNYLYDGDINLDSSRLLSSEKRILFFENDDTNKCRDIKYRWEKSRNHDLYVLSLRGSQKHFNKAFFHEIMEEHIRQYDFSNTNSMEVAISMINLICSCQYEILDIDDGKKNNICAWIKECVEYIFNHVEKGLIYSNNHYFFNVLGLCWIFNYIKSDYYTEELKKDSVNELVCLLDGLLLDDGSLYENSTHYHKYVTEALLEFLFYNSDIYKFDNLINYASKMYSFCCYIEDNNRIFGFGDNDSGRLLPLPEYYQYDSRDLTVIKDLAIRLGLRKETLNKSGTTFGISILRSDNWTVALRCDELKASKKNRVIGSHGHNDQLEILVNYDGIPLVVDYGTYLYIPDNEYRRTNLSVAQHNTLIVEGMEQNTIFNNWDYVPRRAKGRIISESENKIVCEHNGYESMIHRRDVSIDGCVTVIDKLKVEGGTDNVNAYIQFIFSPSYSMTPISQNEIGLKSASGNFCVRTDSWITIKDICIHPEYGQKVWTHAIEIPVRPNESVCTRLIRDG